MSMRAPAGGSGGVVSFVMRHPHSTERGTVEKMCLDPARNKSARRPWLLLLTAGLLASAPTLLARADQAAATGKPPPVRRNDRSKNEARQTVERCVGSLDQA